MPQPEDETGRLLLYWRATWIAAMGSVAMVLLSVLTMPLSFHASQLIATVGLFGVGYAFIRHYALSVPSLRPTIGGTSLALLFGVGLACFGTGSSALIGHWFDALFGATGLGQMLDEIASGRQEALQELLFPARATLIPVVLLVIAVAPSIAEEFVYRGVIPAALDEPRFWPRVAFIGFLFALMHVDPFAFVPLIVVGAGLQWYAERAGGWTSSAVAHFALNAFNGVIFVRLYGLETPPVSLAAGLCGGGLLVAAAALRFARR